MKKGFTIIEVLAVIVVMTLLTVLIVPNIINSVNNKRADVSEASKKIIYDATDLYVTANRVSFPIAEDATYCIKLETLVNNGNLVAPVKDLKSDKEIPLNYYVKVTLDSYEQYNYELVSECTEVGGAISDTTPPTIASVSLKTKTSNSITVVANGYDQESGISHYQFSKDDGKTWTKVQESNEYTFSNLSTGTYKIKSRVINGSYDNKLTNKNYKDSDTNEIETGVITVPIYTIDKVGWQTSKTVTITYPEGEGLTKQYSLDGGNNWQTYTNPVTFTENGTILARVTDGTNTVTGYISGSSYAVSGIDTTTPTIAFNSIPTVITQGDNYAISSYINTTYGPSNGSYSCSSNVDGTVTNLSGLSIGSHTLTCTVTGGSGLSSDIQETIFVFNPKYVMTEANDLIWTYLHSFGSDGNKRTYTKTNAGWTLASYVYQPGLTSNGYHYTGPLLVSLNSDAVTYTVGGDYNATGTYYGTMSYLNHTWYISSIGAWYEYNQVSVNGNALKMPTYTLDSYEAYAKKLIDLALQPTTESTVTLTLGTPTTSTTSISVPLTLNTTELSKLTCKYGTSSGNYTTDCLKLTNNVSTSMTFILNNSLQNNTTYYYKICATSLSGKETCQARSKKTDVILYKNNSGSYNDLYVDGYISNSTASKETLDSLNIDEGLIKSNDYFQIQSSCSGSLVTIMSNSSFDVTNLSTIDYRLLLSRNCDEYEFSSQIDFGLYGNKGVNNNFDISNNLSLTKTELNTGEQQITQNVSGVTGNKYLKMNVYHGDEFDSCTSYARVYSIIGKYK